MNVIFVTPICTSQDISITVIQKIVSNGLAECLFFKDYLGNAFFCYKTLLHEFLRICKYPPLEIMHLNTSKGRKIIRCILHLGYFQHWAFSVLYKIDFSRASLRSDPFYLISDSLVRNNTKHQNKGNTVETCIYSLIYMHKYTYLTIR